MVPMLIIKRHLMRILIDDGNYSALSYSKIFDNLSVYSTAERGNRASKPFQVFYEGNLDITPFITDSCALHWQFKNIKHPLPIFNADRTVWWLDKYDIKKYGDGF
jgi:hypothetical protein